MNASELVGRVAALYLRQAVPSVWTEAEGTSRFVIDRLSAEQLASIANAVLADDGLSSLVSLKLPLGILAPLGVPDAALTDKPATYWRTADCDRRALVLANTGDDEQQSLAELTRIGAQELQDKPDLWVKAVAEGLGLQANELRWWEKALGGLQALRSHPLEREAEYVLRTRDAIVNDGLPLLRALGAALPALRLPADTSYFSGIKERVRGQASQWKRYFDDLHKKRACFLQKQTPAQQLLTEDDLSSQFERVRESIDVQYHPTIVAFIRAQSGWNDRAAALAQVEWERVKPLFDGLRREKFNLGQATLEFYDDRAPGLSLSEDDRDYLKRLIARNTTEPQDEDAEFYELHREELRNDPKLKAYWDKFVFGRPRETDDFVVGLVGALEVLFNRQSGAGVRRLEIRCDRASKKDFKELNVDAGLYFARRYAGLRKLLGDRVTWNVGSLFEFPALVDEWRSKQQGKQGLNHSMARPALQLKFLIRLEVTSEDGTTQEHQAHVVWRYDPNTVATQLDDDWRRLLEHPLPFCTTAREPAAVRGRFQSVDLANAKTFRPVHGRDRGTFVATYRAEQDIAVVWRKNLASALADTMVSPEVAEELKQQFAAFETAYIEALKAFTTDGLSDAALDAQLECYTTLLESILRKAKGDKNRELLLKPLLRIGAVAIEGGRPAVVVTPWHPLRLFAMAQKARMVARLVKYVLAAEQVLIGDSRLFFKDLASDLRHPFYPEVVLGWTDGKPELLAFTDFVLDYSLHELPMVGDEGTDDTNENPTEGSAVVADLLQRYLALHPHEHANMSVVLYNCDSARLPQAVVERVGTTYEGDEDVRCQVLLRHSDPDRLRDLYTDIIKSEDSDVDAFNASEATRDFLARLRICIIAQEAQTEPDPKEGRPYDIVYLQDVIARHARLEWYVERAQPLAADTLVPPRWSRRRPAARDDMKSVVYLCSPAQTTAGWTYLSALTSFLKGDWDENSERRLLPARQLDFRDPKTSRIFEETHNLGNWVVNYDEILDRRQLLNQQVTIIRYKQSATQGRNLVISSKASLALLRTMLLSRLRDLSLDMSDQELVQLANRFITDASDISGDIVLRAAKRGRNASELMGVVLSRYLMRSELAGSPFLGWYFLDDYADWLGQREEQIADILALAPERGGEGGLRLSMLVSEAKYITADSLAAKRKESEKQLRDTMKRIDEAIFGNPERLDRELWLGRLSDLVLDGVQFPAAAKVDLGDWRRAMRDGTCAIHVRGYSHVFVTGPSDGADCASFNAIASLPNGYQEVFGRAETREIVLNYARNRDAMGVRRRVASDDVWAERTYRRPADQVAISVPVTDGTGGDRGGSTPPQPPPVAASGATAGTSATAAGRGPSATGTLAGSGGTVTDVAATNSGWIRAEITSLLAGSAGAGDTPEDEAWLRKVETQARSALQQLQLQAKVLGSVLTPNSGLLKFAGTANLTVEQLLKRRSELLTTYSLPIVSVQPEPGAISVAIERPSRRVVRIQDVWARWAPPAREGNTEIAIGIREKDGSLLFLAPESRHAPHTLIAGSTGSGKSVLMQNLILGIAATNTPEQAEIVLIDPKLGVDYFAFDGLPHIRGGVIDQQDVALDRLRNLVDEMDRRYRDKFKPARVSNLTAYNRKVAPSERLPVIWLIHDEFAEWMMVDEYKQEVTSIVGRLGVKARAAGIYLVFAAQRPDANVMPMQLRANLGNRLILRVDSEGTSEIALGEAGAERLLGRGHLAAKLDGEPGIQFAQVPFVESSFMEQLVGAICGSSVT